jgi:hexulose-6-phosphate isomerase
MKIGIRDGCLQQPWTQVFATAAELGFDGVELDIGANYDETLLFSCEGRTELTKVVSQSGIEISSFCLGICWTLSPASPELEVRRRIHKIATAACAFAAEFGVQWILVPVTPGGEEVNADDGARRWVQAMRDLASLAEDMDVRLCLENVGRGYGKSAGELIRLVDEIASPWVGVYYDIGNAIAFGHDPVAEMEQLGDRMLAVHIKDREADLLGEGIVPIADCVQALLARGYDDYLVLETPPTDDPPAAATANLNYLRGLLSGQG